ncbi:hypothetical protein OG716_12265 [Nocardia sp. NBC_01388]
MAQFARGELVVVAEGPVEDRQGRKPTAAGNVGDRAAAAVLGISEPVGGALYTGFEQEGVGGLRESHCALELAARDAKMFGRRIHAQPRVVAVCLNVTLRVA